MSEGRVTHAFGEGGVLGHRPLCGAPSKGSWCGFGEAVDCVRCLGILTKQEVRGAKRDRRYRVTQFSDRYGYVTHLDYRWKWWARFIAFMSKGEAAFAVLPHRYSTTIQEVDISRESAVGSYQRRKDTTNKRDFEDGQPVLINTPGRSMHEAVGQVVAFHEGLRFAYSVRLTSGHVWQFSASELTPLTPAP